MGGIHIISTSSNVDERMKSDILNIMERALDKGKEDYCNCIATKLKNRFGGSWIVIHHEKDNCDFEMSFAFSSLKWVKAYKDKQYNKYYLFQISE